MRIPFAAAILASGISIGPLVVPEAALAAPAATVSTETDVSKQAAPKIVFESPVLNFGQVNGGESARRNFVFSNQGGRTLEVLDVKVSCGCLVCANWTRETQPGMVGTIPVEFKTLEYSGRITKSITLTCNDPEQPTIILQVEASVWRPIDLTPQSAVFNLSPSGASKGVVVHITNNEESLLTLSELKSSQKELLAELRTIKKGREFEVSVKPAPGTYKGNLFGKISLKTSSKKLPQLEIPVFGVLRSEVTNSAGAH